MDAFVMSESVQPFDESGQKPQRLTNPHTSQVVDATAQALVDRRKAFLQDVEEVICAKVTSLKLPEQYGSPIPAEITRENLYDKVQTPPWNMARQWVSYILRNHPLTQYSFPEIGKLFKREHSTVRSGYNRIEIIVEDWRTTHFIDEFQDVCDTLAKLKYGHMELWRVAGLEKRPKRVQSTPLTRISTYCARTKRAFRNKQIVARFYEGRTQRQLANEFNLRPDSIRRILRKAKVTPRSHSEAIRLGMRNK